MDQEKFGKFLKEIRKKHHLTQKQLADKYHVTYQAVSKWENGKNLPDLSLMKEMSKDFNVSLEEMFDGKMNEAPKKNKKWIAIFVGIAILFVILISVILFQKDSSDFTFKTLSSTCDNFNLSGNIAYNEKKSSIYIAHIQYCGGEDQNQYRKIECTLYETNDNLEMKIDSFKYDEDTPITLEDFLKTVTFTIDQYEKICKEYSENSMFLSISAEDQNGKVTMYKVPLSFQACSK